MADNLYYLLHSDLPSWLEKLAEEKEVLFPHRLDGDWTYRRWEGGEKPEPAPYRGVESLKNFLFPGRVVVAHFPGEVAAEDAPLRERVVIGLKACDLASLPVLDYIFREGDFSDPFYGEARDRTVIISQDCLGFKDVCFCPLVGGQPYPIGGFDLNLTPFEEDCLVEVGSEKGRALIEANRRFFQAASSEQIEAREKLRRDVADKLKEQLEEQGRIDRVPEAAEVEAKSEDKLWEEEAVPCVECGACNLVCPTCHCFILEEVSAASGSIRVRNWDACQYPGFSRVAGGANPRPARSERLSNRFSKKFQFFPEVAGVIACTGCGRCIEACMGKIDIRKILKRIKS